MNAALEVADAAFEELEFQFSHPNAAHRGDVSVVSRKTPKLWKAYRKYAAALVRVVGLTP